MSISMRKVGVLYKKDITDYLKNPALSMATLVPVMFVLLYKFIDVGIPDGSKNQWLLNLGMLLNATMGGVMIAGTSIAEEKEKFTLRTLRLSNVSGGEFLLSKMLSGFSLTMVGNLLIFIMVRGRPEHFLPYLLCTAVGCLSVLMFSGWVGLISRDQMVCGVYQVPLMLIFLLPAAFGGRNQIMELIAKYTPLSAMGRMYEAVLGNGDGKEILFHLGVILAWTLLGVLLFAVTYRRTERDN